MQEIQVDYESSIGSSYLETRVMSSLVRNQLIDEPPVRVFYDPAEYGEGYRSIKGVFLEYVARPVMHNIGWVAVAGLAGATAVYVFAPETLTTLTTTKGLGIAGFAGLVGKVFNLDEAFDKTPAKIARRVFRNNRKPWREAYDKLKITTLDQFNDYMIMAQNPEEICGDGFGDWKNAQALGISIAKIADIASRTKPDSESIKGYKLENLIGMLRVQKIGSDNETEIIYGLLDKFSDKQLADMHYIGSKHPGMDTLNRVIMNHELSIFIKSAGKVTHLGAKMRIGTIYSEEDLGPKAGNYLGDKSVGKDFPIIGCGDDAAQEFMNRSRRGYGNIGGDAEQGLMDGSTGGIAIVRGGIHGEFAKRMNDSTWPSVIISLNGIDYKLMKYSIRNGLVVSLNRDRNLGAAPQIFSFQEYDMKTETLKDDEDSARIACDRVDDYITRWAQTHTVAA